MGLNVGSGESCTISCDDPLAKGCKETIGPFFGQQHTEDIAIQNGWRHSTTNGHWTCPKCRKECDAKFNI